MIEQVLAAVVLLVSVGLLLRLLLPTARRRRVDAIGRRAWLRGRLAARRLWFWRRHQRHAAREADEVIRRARRHAEQDGNVVRPDAFKGPRKPH